MRRSYARTCPETVALPMSDVNGRLHVSDVRLTAVFTLPDRTDGNAQGVATQRSVSNGVN